MSQLMLGPSVYARLAQRRLYWPHLTPQPAIVKHGERLLCCGYCNGAMACFAAAAAGGLRSQKDAGVDLPLGLRRRRQDRSVVAVVLQQQVLERHIELLGGAVQGAGWLARARGLALERRGAAGGPIGAAVAAAG